MSLWTEDLREQVALLVVDALCNTLVTHVLSRPYSLAAGGETSTTEQWKALMMLVIDIHEETSVFQDLDDLTKSLTEYKNLWQTPLTSEKIRANAVETILKFRDNEIEVLHNRFFMYWRNELREPDESSRDVNLFDIYMRQLCDRPELKMRAGIVCANAIKKNCYTALFFLHCDFEQVRALDSAFSGSEIFESIERPTFDTLCQYLTKQDRLKAQIFIDMGIKNHLMALQYFEEFHPSTGDLPSLQVLCMRRMDEIFRRGYAFDEYVYWMLNARLTHYTNDSLWEGMTISLRDAYTLFGMFLQKSTGIDPLCLFPLVFGESKFISDLSLPSYYCQSEPMDKRIGQLIIPRHQVAVKNIGRFLQEVCPSFHNDVPMKTSHTLVLCTTSAVKTTALKSAIQFLNIPSYISILTMSVTEPTPPQPMGDETETACRTRLLSVYHQCLSSRPDLVDTNGTTMLIAIENGLFYTGECDLFDMPVIGTMPLVRSAMPPPIRIFTGTRESHIVIKKKLQYEWERQREPGQTFGQWYVKTCPEASGAPADDWFKAMSPDGASREQTLTAELMQVILSSLDMINEDVITLATSGPMQGVAIELGKQCAQVANLEEGFWVVVHDRAACLVPRGGQSALWKHSQYVSYLKNANERVAGHDDLDSKLFIVSPDTGRTLYVPGERMLYNLIVLVALEMDESLLDAVKMIKTSLLQFRPNIRVLLFHPMSLEDKKLVESSSLFEGVIVKCLLRRGRE
jgi:hypothetical protein